MAVYAIGDVHGCLPELKKLLDAVGFRARHDRLWFVGDVINRGPDSLGTVRFIRDLGERAITLMGNHEARAMIGLGGFADPSFDRQMAFLTQAPDRVELLSWLRQLPFMHRDETLATSMVHAGLYPGWSIEDAMMRARQLHDVMQDDKKFGPFFAEFTDHTPEVEPEEGDKTARLRFAFSVLTRIRLCKENGQLVWTNPVLSPGQPYVPLLNDSCRPWHELGQWSDRETVVYGHWAAAGLQLNGRFWGLDSGCVYGGKLTAVRLDHPDRPLMQVSCPCYVPPEL
ncbi:MAG: symmetrical bis(5'-nucleosyl)-tetraphosphatase [Magnetococcus sp. YQC-5]